MIKIDLSIQLAQAKTAKLQSLVVAKYAFCALRFLYQGNTFNLTDNGTANAVLKNDLPIIAPNRYKYWGKDSEEEDIHVDFEDDIGWLTFFNAIIAEKDSIMDYYCTIKKAIKDAADMETLEAIVIDFSA